MTPESMTPESTIIALWITWLVSWGVAAFWSNRTEKTGGTIAEIGFRILMWAGAILLLVPFSDRLDYARVPFWHLNAALKWILAALTAIGLLFVWWARIHLGRSLVGCDSEKGRSPCCRYRPISLRAPSDLFRPHLCRLCNRHRETNSYRSVWGRYLNLRLLHKSAKGGTLPAVRNRRSRLRCLCTQDRNACAIYRQTAKLGRHPTRVTRVRGGCTPDYGCDNLVNCPVHLEGIKGSTCAREGYLSPKCWRSSVGRASVL